jgi:hypothetical protein
MGFMAIQTGNIIFMGRFLSGNSPDFFKMALKAILFRQRLSLNFGDGNRSEPAA